MRSRTRHPGVHARRTFASLAALSAATLILSAVPAGAEDGGAPLPTYTTGHI